MYKTRPRCTQLNNFQRERENMFDEQYVESLPELIPIAAGKICDDFLEMDNNIQREGVVSANFDVYVNAWHFIKTFCTAVKLPIDTKLNINPDSKTSTIDVIRDRIIKFRIMINELQNQELNLQNPSQILRLAYMSFQLEISGLSRNG